MDEYERKIEAAFLAGEWETAFREAAAWRLAIERSEERNSRPYFACNVVHLIRGQVAAAWKLHGKALEETEDIDQVRTWVEAIRERHPEKANAHLLFEI